MSEQRRIHGHGHDDEDDELPQLPTSGQLTHDVPTAPDPDVGPAGTKEVPAPPGRQEAESELPQ
jgi:hypothetical protein